MKKRLYAIGITLLMMCKLLLFVGCANKAESTLFDDFVRIDKNGEKIYVTEKEIKEDLAEEQFVQYLSEDEKMRITLAITPCDELLPDTRFGGNYHVEAWFEWLEVPKNRGTDNISLEMDNTSWLCIDTVSILRYQTKNGKIFEKSVSSNFKTAEWDLPSGSLTALQIYKEIYVTMTYPSLSQYTSCFAEYTHNNSISRDARYNLYHRIEYTPVAQE